MTQWNLFWWQSPRKDVELMLYILKHTLRISELTKRAYEREFGVQ